MEDQTFEDIDMVEKTTHKKGNNLSDVKLVRLVVNNLDIAESSVQNGT